MLRIKSTIYLTGQANNNDRNSKLQTLEFPWNLLARRLFGGVLGICDFGLKTPRQSQISLPCSKKPGFSGKNKT